MLRTVSHWPLADGILISESSRLTPASPRVEARVFLTKSELAGLYRIYVRRYHSLKKAKTAGNN